MHTQSHYYVRDTAISVNLPRAFSCHEVRSKILLGLPSHLGTLPLFTCLVLSSSLSPARLQPARSMCPFRQGPAFCLNAQDVTTSNKVLVVMAMTVWGGQQPKYNHGCRGYYENNGGWRGTQTTCKACRERGFRVQATLLEESKLLWKREKRTLY